jgi:hypothetical protein
MFKWLKRFMGNDTVVHTVNIHITGKLTLKHEGRQGHSVAPAQGPVDSHATPQAGDGVDKGSRPAEPDIAPEFFADTGTPEVSFGIDAEEPPKGPPA